MQNRLANEFGKRSPSTIAPTGAHPVKRSRHVALLLMGSLAVGGGAFAMMPRENCEPKGGAVATPALPQGSTECRSSSSGRGYGGSGGSWSRSSFFGGDSSSNRSSSGTSSESGSGQATRGGFGGFARSLAAHFSGS